ncbi:uncharacterized [Tachysurus ichikawai]
MNIKGQKCSAVQRKCSRSILALMAWSSPAPNTTAISVLLRQWKPVSANNTLQPEDMKMIIDSLHPFPFRDKVTLPKNPASPDLRADHVLQRYLFNDQNKSVIELKELRFGVQES